MVSGLDGVAVDYLDELHRLYQARRPQSDLPCYVYRAPKVLHLHFRSRGCRFGRCICCDYGCAKEPVTRDEIDFVFTKELVNCDKPQALLLGSLGSLLDLEEVNGELLSYLLDKVARTGIQDVTLETSWWSITPAVVRKVMNALPGVTVTFECGLESSRYSVRSTCYGKPISDEVLARGLEVIKQEGAQVCANVMLGAPFMSVPERMQDTQNSIRWALETAGIDDVVVFPVNVRPYTGARALYDLALYEPTRIQELVGVLLSLPDWALARTHISWFGERSTQYSLGDILPRGCHNGTLSITRILESYMDVSYCDRNEMSLARRELLRKAALLLADAGEPAFDVLPITPPSAQELSDRRAKTCELALKGGKAKLVWVSPRESDLHAAAELFVGSSTVYGSNEGGNRSYSSLTGWRENHNDVTPQQIECMARDQLDFAHKDPAVRFMAYNPYYTHGGNPSIVERSICLNDAKVLADLCDKRSFRRFAAPFVRVPDSCILRCQECTSQRLSELFPEGAVVQRGISSGGEGTWVVLPGEGLDKHPVASAVQDDATLDDALNERLLVSRYYAENIPINVHAVIYEQAIVLLPPSIQLIEARGDNLLYSGCDYVSYGDLSQGIRDDFARQARDLCSAVAKTGYRGVLGLDAIVTSDGVLFLEMNARFQGSSHALSQALADLGLPTLQELHREAFMRSEPSVAPRVLEQVSVPYSTLAYSSRGSKVLDLPIEHLLRTATRMESVEVFEDGLRLEQPRRSGAYLFSLRFRGRVSSVHFDRIVNVDQNVSCWGPAVPTSAPVDDESWMPLKIALLNQGVTITDDARRIMDKAGCVREGVNDAIDLELGGRVVNAPISLAYQAFSPFELDVTPSGSLALDAYGTYVCDASVSYRDQVEGIRTPSGVPVSRICFLATDRVRVQHHDCCDVAESGMQCRFCNFPPGHAGFDLQDIDFAVARYLESGIEFRHFLVGGGSDLAPGALERTISAVRSIRKRCDKPIYLMDLPPKRLEDLHLLQDAGVDEVAFNIEIYDRAIARNLMPLKGAIPLKRYLNALEMAVSIWGRNGAVRSALVVGLEPMSSTLAGIEALASRGVAPILSVFRPVTYSDLHWAVGPDNAWLTVLYREAAAICSSYDVVLGPECRACRNNVLAP